MSHPDVQTIENLLSDSLIQAVMRADGVEVGSLRRLLKAAAAGGRQRGPTPDAIRARVNPERRALPAPAALRLLPPEWLGGCSAGVCG